MVEPKIEKPRQEEINISKIKHPGKKNIVAKLLKKGGTEIRRKIKMILTTWDTEIFQKTGILQ